MYTFQEHLVDLSILYIYLMYMHNAHTGTFGGFNLRDILGVPRNMIVGE